MPSCILYFCKSDPKKFKKDYVQVSNEFTITFNKDVDIMDPVFRFSKNVSALNFNYIFVPALDNRNYWVTSPPVYSAKSSTAIPASLMIYSISESHLFSL